MPRKPLYLQRLAEEHEPVNPLQPHQLEPVLRVIEAAQTLAEGDDVPQMLANLARQLTEFLDATACFVSVLDPDRDVLIDRAGYARPPYVWEGGDAEEHAIADYPRTAQVLRTGRPYQCVLDGGKADPAESQWLRDLGYRSLLLLRMTVDGDPFALVELYDVRPRTFTDTELRLGLALSAEAGTMVTRARLAERVEDAYFATLGTLAAALEAKDAYTNDHAAEIAHLAGAVCDELGVGHAESRIVRLGALLHDIGKIGIPEAILRKPGALTIDEMRVMQQHPNIGARILRPVPFFADLVPLVRSSHERWDGRGYPEGLAGDEIPLGSRVIAVCDAFHAMTEDRVYRPAMTDEEAACEIERCSGTQFDPVCVEALVAVVHAGGARVQRPGMLRTG